MPPVPTALRWTKHAANPVFAPIRRFLGKHKVTGCQVEKRGDWYLMFYIGFRDVDHAQIGIARSQDGITNGNAIRPTPSSAPGENRWDHDACYKPLRHL